MAVAANFHKRLKQIFLEVRASAPRTNLLMRSLPILQDSQGQLDSPSIIPFDQNLADHGFLPLSAQATHTLQVNVGRVCNQTCHHCHVDAGPQRTEVMSRKTIDEILDVLARTPQLTTVDITGGAPEMNPHFEHLVIGAHALGRHVIDRCNLTVFFVKGEGSPSSVPSRPSGGNYRFPPLLPGGQCRSATWERCVRPEYCGITTIECPGLRH